MTAVTRELRGVWGVDLDVPLTPALLAALCATRVPSALDVTAPPISFFTRYVGLQASGHGDLSADETERVTESGRALVVVQHVRYPGWVPSGAQGTADGLWAVKNAQAAGYDVPGACLTLDLEGVAQSSFGAPAIAFALAWSKAVADAGYAPTLYVGYDCGINPAQLYALAGFALYWSDAGPRHVDTRGFAAKQHQQQVVAGVPVDFDYAAPDALGGVIVGMADDGVAVA